MLSYTDLTNIMDLALGGCEHKLSSDNRKVLNLRQWHWKEACFGRVAGNYDCLEKELVGRVEV